MHDSLFYTRTHGTILSLWKLREKKNVAQMHFIKITPKMLCHSKMIIVIGFDDVVAGFIFTEAGVLCIVTFLGWVIKDAPLKERE